MKEDTYLLLNQGWQSSFKPIYFLGFDISWLVMEEAFISPFDHRKYSFNEAMRIALNSQANHEWAA
ncbi:hypothetical protein [Rufibacter tibetensis]|uniref:Uncharacterized protein n=1 Tax=Rufibacter tibetensis TaxID=512763 RepID=A0A0P0CR03_9BACT|nr:hypothetical protein [Rufibacter tibetensis]ALI98865.1 hypothetical protein DC20_07605 [Rufibacter tibetensis]